MTPRAAWVERALAGRHGRAGFDCGTPALNEYLRRYDLSPGAIAFAHAPVSVTKRLGR